MKKYSEFTKLSIHNHFGSKDSEKKINESFNKITSMEYNSVIERLEENGSIIFNTGLDGMVMFDFTNNKIKTYK